MLDPSLPWLSHGYKKHGDDLGQKYLSDVDYAKHADISPENRLRVSTPRSEQQERVRSATVRRIQEGRTGSAHSRDSADTYLFLRESRPRSAYSLYSVKSFMSGPPQVRNKRAKSATVRRKAADLQKSFTQIERSYEEVRLDRNFRKLARPRTAQGLVRGRPNVTWSGDWRPTSSTGLVPTTPFDRYVSYERPTSARRSHSPLKDNEVRRGDTPQFFDISKKAWLHDRPPQSPPCTPPPPRRVRTPVRIVRTPSHVSARAGSAEPSTVEMSPPPSPPPEEDISLAGEEEEDQEEADWQDQIEVSVQMKEPEPPPPSPTPEPPEEPELVWDEEEKEEEQPKPLSSPPTPPREPTPPPREPTPPPREPTPPPREPTPPPREPTPPPRDPTPPPEPEKEPTPPPSPPPVETPPTPPPPSPTPEDPVVEEEPVEVSPPLVEEQPPPPTPSPEPVIEEPPSEIEEPPTMEEPEPEPELEPEPESEPEPIEVKEVRIEEVEVVEPPKTPEPPAEKSDEEMEEPAAEAEPPPEEDTKKGRKKSARGKKKKKRKAPPKVDKSPVQALMMDPSEILNMEMKLRRKNLLENKAENDAIVAEVQEFEVKRPKQQAWLQGRLALSRQISRFELPMDMRLLEGMSPIEYLSNYCIVSKRRQNLYKQSFSKADRDRDGIINVKELDKALKQIHVDGVTTEQVQKILEVIQATDDTKFDAKLFVAVCALAERMLYTYFVTEDTDDIMYSQKERVEDADFCALEWKLHGVKVNPPIKRLLQML